MYSNGRYLLCVVFWLSSSRIVSWGLVYDGSCDSFLFRQFVRKKCVNNGNKKTILFFVSLNIFIILAITINIIIVNCIPHMLLLIVKCTTDAGNVPIVIKSLINIPNRGTVSKFKSSSFSLPFVYHLPRRPPQLPPIQFKS